jgi:aspartyl-tRNA(Asn)/glutamyl-tRNA(Gln) amidotransferase subunit A
MKFTIKDVLNLYENKKLNFKELLTEIIKNYEETKNLNAYIDTYFNENENENKIPIAVKDAFFMKNKKCSAGSAKLKDFVAPYDSTIIKRLSKDCFFTGRTNCDEFFMGSSGKTSYYGLTETNILNKNGEKMSPGGSSSGSACALLTKTCLASLGTDTGGSVRQPAAWCGLIGYKPTYGLMSRYGVIDFANSLDHPSYFANSVWDIEWIFNKLIGKCSNDYTTVNFDGVKERKKQVGILLSDKAEDYVNQEILKSAKVLENHGYKIREISLPLLKYALQIYYIINTSEAASNLARYSNELFYGKEEFGEEVKRRIEIGKHVTKSTNISGLYDHSRKVLQKIWIEFKEIFEECDAILIPTVPSIGMTIEETKNPDPIRMYYCDYFTCIMNLIGLPAMHLPTNTHENLSIGIQIVSKPMGDKIIFEIASLINQENEILS